MSAARSVSASRRLVESAIMIAIATALSLIKFIDLPYGGSVTLACMLPVIIISYRHGLRWGLLTGIVYAILQQLLGLKTLSYVTTWQSILAVIFLDYIIAFAVTGLGGIFRRFTPQPYALLFGSIFVCILRYICHVISGATVWAGLSIPDNAALMYSFSYNATYMIPETIITALIGFYIGSILDFAHDDIVRFRRTRTRSLPVFKWLGGLSIVAALVYDSFAVFPHLQNEESGVFDITGLANVNWTSVIIVTVAGALLAVLFFVMAHRNTEA